MPAAPVLEGSAATLRPVRSGDIDARLALGRDPEFIRLVGGDPGSAGPLTPAEAAAQVEPLIGDPLAWAIEADGSFAGTARLHSHDAANRRARYAVGIFAQGLWGRGIGTEVTKLVLAHAFEHLGLHRVDLRVLEENSRAVTCYKKCGFQVEGREREGLFVGGGWKSDLVMSVLEHEWRDPHTDPGVSRHQPR